MMKVFETELAEPATGAAPGAWALGEVNSDMLETPAMLRATLVCFAREPVVINECAISCPRCGSADELRLWLPAGKTTVKVEHGCRGRHAREGKGHYRRWDDPRVTVEYMHEHGETMLDRCDSDDDELDGDR